MRAYLRIKNRNIPLGPINFIGRDVERCAITLEGPTISRVHALIVCSDSGYRLLDCKSRNGVQVNGARVESWDLRHMDLIELAPYQVEFIRSPAPILESDPQAAEELTLLEDISSILEAPFPSPGNLDLLLQRISTGLGSHRTSMTRVDSGRRLTVTASRSTTGLALEPGDSLLFEGIDALTAGSTLLLDKNVDTTVVPTSERGDSSESSISRDADGGISGRVLVVPLEKSIETTCALMLEFEADSTSPDLRMIRMIQLVVDRIGWAWGPEMETAVDPGQESP